MAYGDPRVEFQTPLASLTLALARLARARSTAEVVEIIRSNARSLIGADGISIVRREDGFCRYIEEDAIGPLWKGQTFPASICVSGWAILNRETVVIPDIDLDDRIPKELYAATFVRSLMMVPIAPEDPVGAIGAYWSQPYTPTRMEIEVIEALASAAATAIENVRLIDALNDALKDAELARDELRHRVKNVYMGAQAIVRLGLPKEQADTVAGRLAALARAHALLDEKLTTTPEIGLRDLIEAEIQPYATESGRFVLEGPSIVVPSSIAVPLGLIINEFATNALKHGSLSTLEGKVAVSWDRVGTNLVLQWMETDGPLLSGVPAPSEGSRLLRRLVEGQLAGTLETRLDPQGARHKLAFEIKDKGAAEPARARARA